MQKIDFNKIQVIDLDKPLEVGDICKITSGTWNGTYIRLNNDVSIYDDILKSQQLTLLDKDNVVIGAYPKLDDLPLIDDSDIKNWLEDSFKCS